MRVSLLVIFTLLGMAMGQPQGVRFRDSMLGHMISDTVAGGRNAVTGVMDVFSTIGNGMSKMIGVPGGSRRQNKLRGNQPQFRQSGVRDGPPIRDGGLRPLDESDLEYDYETAPRPARPQQVRDYDYETSLRPARPQRRRPRPQAQGLFQAQRVRNQPKNKKLDPLQRLSNNEILGLANPQANHDFNNRQQHFSLQKPSTWFK